VRRRTRRLVLALGIVGLLAYLLALPALVRAGRALRAQYDPRRVELVRERQRAIDRGELLLHFQPIVEAAQRTARASAEALVRWQHPAARCDPARPLHPGRGARESCGRSRSTCSASPSRLCRRWRARATTSRVAVNVSARAARPPAAREVDAVLGDTPRARAELEIEVTEGAVMRDPAAATRSSAA
jgi:EAL domain-containing protein (putative c-di-GMP-specific phosphodiesterase class I)